MNSFSLKSSSDSPQQQDDSYMPAQAAAEYSGYSVQYLRRLLSTGVVAASRIGQVWLVSKVSLDAYIKRIQNEKDRRYGPRVFHEFMQEHHDDQASS